MSDKSKIPFELINKQNAIKPNYALDRSNYYFEVYISHTQEICVVCRMDNNYISGLSFSSVSDLERTQAIVDGMASNAGMIISNMHSVLGKEMFYKVSKWYRLLILKSPDYADGKHYKTRHFEAEYQFQQSGIAKAIKDSFDNLIKKCNYRLADGLYIPVLEKHFELLSKYSRNDKEAYRYYLEMESLIADVVRKESYLKLSPNTSARELYIKISNCADALYGAYMDIAR